MATQPGVLRVAVRVQPRAAHTRVLGRHGAAIRVQVRALPVDGNANAAVVALLASTFGVPRNAVRLVHGRGGRDKLFDVKTADLAACQRRLEELLGRDVDKAGGGG
jgi:uncharacterized protein (TIGR00251 family)